MSASSSREALLYGVDFSFDQAIDPHVVVCWPPVSPGPTPALNDVLTNIPAQPTNIIRVFLEWNLGPGTRPEFDTFVEQLLQKPYRSWYYEEYSSTSLADIIAQCHGDDQNSVPWEFTMTSFIKSPEFFRPFSSKLNGHTMIWRQVAHLLKDAKGNTVLFLSCNGRLPGTTRQAQYWDLYRLMILELIQTMEKVDHQYKTATRGITLRPEDQSMILVLHFLHSKILMQYRALNSFYNTFYDETIAHVTRHIQANTGIPTDTAALLRRLAMVSSHVDRQLAEVKPVALAMETLLDMLSPAFSGSADFRRLDASIRGISKSLLTSMEDILTRLEARLKFLEISRNISETTSLWLLSLLAAIFLPLSLASSLLSMQTRLVDLHFLLYDFCGVFILFGSIAFVAIWAIRRLTRKKGTSHGLAKVNNRWFRTVLLLGWATIIASFLVGIIVDVGLGLKILYLGAPVVAGLLLVTWVVIGLYAAAGATGF